MEMYRSGHNEADSKSVGGSNRPGVRIPSSPPKSQLWNVHDAVLLTAIFFILHIFTKIIPAFLHTISKKQKGEWL